MESGPTVESGPTLENGPGNDVVFLNVERTKCLIKTSLAWYLSFISPIPEIWKLGSAIAV